MKALARSAWEPRAETSSAPTRLEDGEGWGEGDRRQPSASLKT